MEGIPTYELKEPLPTIAYPVTIPRQLLDAIGSLRGKIVEAIKPVSKTVWIIAGIVIVVVAVYFLFIKK